MKKQDINFFQLFVFFLSLSPLLLSVSKKPKLLLIQIFPDKQKLQNQIGRAGEALCHISGTSLFFFSPPFSSYLQPSSHSPMEFLPLTIFKQLPFQVLFSCSLNHLCTLSSVFSKWVLFGFYLGRVGFYSSALLLSKNENGFVLKCVLFLLPFFVCFLSSISYRCGWWGEIFWVGFMGVEEVCHWREYYVHPKSYISCK